MGSGLPLLQQLTLTITSVLSSIPNHRHFRSVPGFHQLLPQMSLIYGCAISQPAREEVKASFGMNSLPDRDNSRGHGTSCAVTKIVVIPCNGHDHDGAGLRDGVH